MCSKKYCLYCKKKNTIKNGTYERTIIDRGKVKTANKIQRYFCKDCQRTFSFLPYNIEPKCKYTEAAKQEMVESKFWYGSGYRKVGGLLTDNIRYPGTTIWRVVQKNAKKARRWLKRFEIPFKKIRMGIDEKFLKCKGGIVLWINAILLFKVGKSWYGIIIHHDTLFIRNHTIRDKRKLRKWLRERQKPFTERFIKRVKKKLGDREVELVVTDFDSIYPQIIAKYFPEAIHQICTFHIEKGIYKSFEKEFGTQLKENIEDVRNKLISIFYVDTKEKATSILNCIPLDRFKQGGSVQRVINKIKNWEDRIFNFFQTGIRTNNTIEQIFSRVDPLFEVMKSFQSESGTKNFLSCLVEWTNTCPFVDGKFKGMSPVDLLQSITT